MSRWRRLGLGLQLTTMLVLTSAAVLCGVALVLAHRAQAEERAALDRELTGRAAQAHYAGRLAASSRDPTFKLGVAELVGQGRDLSVVVAGRVVLGSGRPVPATRGCATIGTGAERRRACTRGDGRDTATVAAPASTYLDEARAVRSTVAGIAVLALACTALMTAVVVSAATRPLRRLADLVRRLDPRDDPLPATPAGSAEVEEVGRALREAHERLAAEAEAVERSLEAARRFTADAAHELRTPLMTLSADLEVLRRLSTAPGSEQAAVLEDALVAHARIERTLSSLLALARADAGLPAHRSLVRFDRLVADEVAAARRRHPFVAFRASLVEVAILATTDGLARAVANLLENAATHGASPVTATLRGDADAAIFTVEDVGPGFSSDLGDRVFDRFVRGERVRTPGSGLGLAIVRGEAAALGGRVTLREPRAPGARVELRVPRAQDLAAPHLATRARARTRWP